MIDYKKDTSHSYKYNITTKVNVGNWLNLGISQMSGVFEIKVDYKLVYNKTNSVSKTWTSVNLVTGNTNGKEDNSTAVRYRNFKINTCKTKGKNGKLYNTCLT